MSYFPNGPDGPRIQDGTIKNADDFWELIQDVGYIIEGENRDYERERLHWLGQCLDKWLATHGEIGAADADLHRFAIQSVVRLAQAFAFNDMIGANDPGLGLIQGIITEKTTPP